MDLRVRTVKHLILLNFFPSLFLHSFQIISRFDWKPYEVRSAVIRIFTFFFFAISLQVLGEDWYSYYIQCVATSSQEASCYQEIRDFLATEEGRRQADEIGFKRRLYRDQNQISSQSIIISNRIQQMEKFVISSLANQESEEQSLRRYCLNEKKNQIEMILKQVETLKSSLLSQSDAAQNEQSETDYQLMLSLNTRANEVYQQARKCLQ